MTDLKLRFADWQHLKPVADVSLHDWFAGMAMLGLLLRGGQSKNTAKKAYELADAMMKEKDVKTTN